MEKKNNFSRNVVIGGFAMLIAILMFAGTAETERTETMTISKKHFKNFLEYFEAVDTFLNY